MNINFKFLLLGTSLSLIPNLIQAQCVATTDCASLGYTETTNIGGCLKCPFGNAFVCPSSEASVCEKYGFKYDCKGTGYIGGSGQKCNNLYASCSCGLDYEWKNAKCEKRSGTMLGQCTGYAKNCKIGDILNSDGTCSTDKVSGKTPIGVVITVEDNCGYAMSFNIISVDIIWSAEYVATGAFQSSNQQQAIKDFDAGGNMTKIIQAANKHGNSASSYYPAAYAVLNYAPSAALTTRGKWMLPTAGILNNFDLCAFNKNVPDLAYRIRDNENILSSSEYNDSNVWVFNTGQDNIPGYIRQNLKNDVTRTYVRPVIEF